MSSNISVFSFHDGFAKSLEPAIHVTTSEGGIGQGKSWVEIDGPLGGGGT